MRSNYFDDLELDIAQQVKNAVDLIVTPIPEAKIDISLEELQEELLSLTAMHHLCAMLKSKGKTHAEISKYIKREHKYTVTEFEVAYMVNKVLNLNYRMTPRSTELLKQQVENQLDNMVADMYSTAAEDGRSYLKPSEAKIILGIVDRKMKLHGLDAPIKIEIDEINKIKLLQENIYKRLDKMETKEIGNTGEIEDSNNISIESEIIA